MIISQCGMCGTISSTSIGLKETLNICASADHRFQSKNNYLSLETI